jgi:sporulation protein YlmC with PRC-barrel domain
VKWGETQSFQTAQETTPLWARMSRCNNWSMLARARLFLLCVLFVAGEASPACAAPSPWPALRNQQATHIIGMAVENSDGESLGRVKDFIVDIRAGEIPFAILASGGVFGFGTRLKVVPVSALSLATAKKGVVYLPIESARWPGAPVFTKRQLATCTLPQQKREILAFYKRVRGVVSATGRDTREAAGSDARLASDLTGIKLVDQNGKPIGVISDFLVGFYRDKPSFLIFKSKTGGHKRSYAAPLRDLSASSSKKLVLHLDPAGLTETEPQF